jgi:hypothetical protein
VKAALIIMLVSVFIFLLIHRSMFITHEQIHKTIYEEYGGNAEIHCDNFCMSGYTIGRIYPSELSEIEKREIVVFNLFNEIVSYWFISYSAVFLLMVVAVFVAILLSSHNY